jgi:hypothetical protein
MLKCEDSSEFFVVNGEGECVKKAVNAIVIEEEGE